MGKCKDCKYWNQDFDSLHFYNENFGECSNKKVIDMKNIEIDYADNKNKRFNKYDIIYSADEIVQLKMNREFGCINFEEK